MISSLHVVCGSLILYMHQIINICIKSFPKFYIYMYIIYLKYCIISKGLSNSSSKLLTEKLYFRQFVSSMFETRTLWWSEAGFCHVYRNTLLVYDKYTDDQYQFMTCIQTTSTNVWCVYRQPVPVYGLNTVYAITKTITMTYIPYPVPCKHSRNVPSSVCETYLE